MVGNGTRYIIRIDVPGPGASTKVLDFGTAGTQWPYLKLRMVRLR